MSPDSGLRVLQLDEGFMSGAIAAVGLREVGCRMTVLAAAGGHGSCRRPGIDWRLLPSLADARLPVAISGAVVRERPDVIFPATEPLQALVWETPSLCAGVPVFPVPATHVRPLLRDKYRLSAHLAALEVPSPEQRRLPELADVGAAVAALGLPLIVKGAWGRGGSGTRVARTLEEAHDAARTLSSRGICSLAQEYVSGPTYLAGGVFADGEPLRLYTGIKTVQHPPRTGPAARIRSVREPRLAELTLAVFAALRWTGIGSTDFVRHPDGRFLFLEVNPRPWGSMAAAASAGVELFRPLAALMRGERWPADLSSRADVECAVFPLNLLSATEWRSGRALRDSIRELRTSGSAWGDARQASHLLHRLYRVGRNWSA